MVVHILLKIPMLHRSFSLTSQPLILLFLHFFYHNYNTYYKILIKEQVNESYFLIKTGFVRVIVMYNRFLTMRYTLIGLATVAILLSVFYSLSPSFPQMQENSANFSETEKAEVRGFISKAGIMFSTSYPTLAEYVKSEMRLSYGSFWNVAVYSKQDYNAKFFLTGTADSTHLNKRFFQVTDSQPYGFSILILETNNTSFDQAETKQIQASHSDGSLQYTKTKSQYVSTAQQAGIDLAITTAYTWNKNIVDFTKVLQKLTETNLNEHWEVLTSYESLPNFGFRYTSPYEQWIQYSGYGLGVTHWHVYVWRNVITG